MSHVSLTSLSKRLVSDEMGEVKAMMMTGMRTMIQTVWVRERRVAGTIQSSLPTAHLLSYNTRPGILTL